MEFHLCWDVQVQLGVKFAVPPPELTIDVFDGQFHEQIVSAYALTSS